jgi:dihydrofolate reductase
VKGPTTSAQTTRQFLRAGLLDEIQINLVPVRLGAGTRLFEHLHEHLGTAPIELERTRMVGSSTMTHLVYRLVK